jgi:hypothetical protein
MNKPQAILKQPRPASKLTTDVLEPERPLTNAERLMLYYIKRNRLEQSFDAARVELYKPDL